MLLDKVSKQQVSLPAVTFLARRLAGAAEALLTSLKDHEKSGVPQDAGKDVGAGFDLARMRHLLSQMRNPQARLKVVHIAGTKGKGGTAAMLSSILHHSGLKVGTYTSPHISSINERISVNLRAIDSAALDGLAEKWKSTIEAANAEVPTALTHFEVLTALAIAHFAEQQVDVAVVEAGLGGIRDATNVFTSKQLMLAIVTTLGLEHQAALGSTLKEIAAAKAGIAKEGRPLLVARQDSEAIDLLREKANASKSPFEEASMAVTVTSRAFHLDAAHAVQDFLIRLRGTDDQQRSEVEVKSKLMGVHQAINAETAVAAAQSLTRMGLSEITTESLRAGLEACQLPGRFQVSKLGPTEPWLILDGAHTPGSAAALIHTLRQAFKSLPLGLVVAMAEDKDHPGVLAALRKARPHVVTFTTVPIAGSDTRSAPPGMLVGHWQAEALDEDRPLRCRELMLTNMAAAMEASMRELAFANGNAVICVTGSLHAVSAARHFGKPFEQEQA